MFMNMENFGLMGIYINVNFLNKKNKSAVMKDKFCLYMYNMVLLGK